MKFLVITVLLYLALNILIGAVKYVLNQKWRQPHIFLACSCFAMMVTMLGEVIFPNSLILLSGATAFLVVSASLGGVLWLLGYLGERPAK